MPSRDPLISVVIPVFNRADGVSRAVASLATGDDRPDEVIVVDDGSTDGSAEAALVALEMHGFAAAGRVLIQENRGAGAARNRGAAKASGRYIAFLDSDDRWFPWTCTVLRQTLLRAGDPVLLFLEARLERDPKIKDPMPMTDPNVEVYAGFLEAVGRRRRSAIFGTLNLVLSRACFESAGGFESTMRCSEDSDLFLRLDRSGPCLLVRGAPLVGCFQGDDTLTGDPSCVASGLKSMVERERQGLYPGGAWEDPMRCSFHAGGAVFAARIAFARGRPVLAYSLILRYLGLMVRGGQARWLWRLALTPLLSLVRPQSYPFRFHS